MSSYIVQVLALFQYSG